MNRYSTWENAIVIIVVLLGILYFIPNLYGVSPSVQIRNVKSSTSIDHEVIKKIEDSMKETNISYKKKSITSKNSINTLEIIFNNSEDQIFATNIIGNILNKHEYIITQNIISNSPNWMNKLGPLSPKPMVLGLDLRGGVHLLIKIDLDKAISSKYDNLVMDIKSILKKNKIEVQEIYSDGFKVVIVPNNKKNSDEIVRKINNSLSELVINLDKKTNNQVECRFNNFTISEIKTNALQQNLITLNNRINALGVAEPIIQQQGFDKIIVQLPGMQDVMKAKEILGRTATIEFRLVDDSASSKLMISNGIIPIGSEYFKDKQNNKILVHSQSLLNSMNINNARPGRDNQTGRPSVNLTLDNKGSKIFRDITRDNINKRLAILLFEEGKGELVTAPVIRSEIPNGNIQITGSMSYQEASDISLLLRSGLLAAPMSLIEEKIIGPSLGLDNINKGLKSIFCGFFAIVIFMIFYYRLFGVFSSIGLALNMVLLVSILSIIQATITLPGIAAIALTVGISIDANVLINERIREELRNGIHPRRAIEQGFDRAWNTILDSNITAFIVGLSLLALGSGSVKGFAVVHCLGIISSIFSSVFFVKFLIKAYYEKEKKLSHISIGYVWKQKE